MKPVAFDYTRPTALADAYAALRQGHGEAKPVSGCQSLGPMLNLRLARPGQLVDLRQLPVLREVAESPDAVGFGAGLPHAAFEDGLVPDPTRGMMRHVAGGIAYRAVRNRGTIGGSIAHADPAADWISTLLALDARLQIGNGKTSRLAALDAFMQGGFSTDLAEDDLIERVIVPRLSADAAWSYYKICRKTGEFAKAIGAVVCDRVRGVARVVCGAIESTPILLTDASARLAEGDRDGAITAVDAEIEQRLAARSPEARQMYKTAVKRAVARLGEMQS
jgi:carbon-monoxide dehydrogenase medium subunit